MPCLGIFLMVYSLLVLFRVLEEGFVDSPSGLLVSILGGCSPFWRLDPVLGFLYLGAVAWGSLRSSGFLLGCSPVCQIFLLYAQPSQRY